MTRKAYNTTAVNPTIFRAYDIRGIVDEQITEDVFYTLGKAISWRLKQLDRHKILVARDGRLSSPALTKALIQGLLDSGLDVIDLGLVTTPIMYFATHVSGIDSGLMVTGSHNPKNYNGLKMVLAGVTLRQDDIILLHQLVQKNATMGGQGHYECLTILKQYTQRIVDDIRLQRPFKVVVDCGNGVAGLIAPHILRQLGCEVVELFCDIDGNFPNHHPDPTVESNLYDLKQAVQAHNADIGLAFDGDADRLGVITNQNELIWPDRLMMLYAQDILQRVPGAVIVFDVKCSKHLAEVITTAGGVARMCPTGHSNVKGIMRDVGAALAGEMSGHLFFKERWYGFDDAIYSASRLLEILSHSTQSVSDQFLSVPNSVNTPELTIAITDDKKFQFMEKFIAQAVFQDAELIMIDGLRVEFSYGWGLLRVSNTTPCLVARFEADDLPSLQTIQAEFHKQLKKLENDLVIPF